MGLQDREVQVYVCIIQIDLKSTTHASQHSVQKSLKTSTTLLKD